MGMSSTMDERYILPTDVACSCHHTSPILSQSKCMSNGIICSYDSIGT